MKAMLRTVAVMVGVTGMGAAWAAGQGAIPPAKEPKSVPMMPIKPAPKDKDDGKKIEVTLKVGDKAPAFAPESFVKGEPVKSLEKGKVYVVEFWATWCGPCIENIPHLTQLQKEHSELTVIGVASSERKPEEGKPDKRLETLRAFVEKKGDAMGYRVAYDPKRTMADTWLRAAGWTTIPTAFVVRADGKIGYIGDPDEMKKAVEEALKQGAAGKKDEPKKEEKK